MAKKKKEFVRFKEVSVPMLNVRSNPSLSGSLIIKVLFEGTVVECDKNFDNPEWDHIVTGQNIEGYCMKKFLVPAKPDILAVFGKDPIIINTTKCDAVTGDKENKDDDKEKDE